MGGLGLRSAVRTAPAAHWGSWADCLHTISERHTHVAHTMTDALISPSVAAVHLTGAVWSRASLAESGFVCPEWTALVEGFRPNQPGRDEVDPADHTHGWQFFAAQRVEHHFRATTVWPRMAPTEQALLRSQSGPMSGVAFSAVPSSPPTRLAPQLFRVLLLRSGSPSLSLLAPAGVADHSILVATTVQRVREPECWAVVDILWRAPLPGCVGKQGPGFPQISLSGIWTCLSLLTMLVGWRWSRMACLSLGGPSWPSTPLLCPRCVQMGNPEVSAPVRTGQPWLKLTA